MALPYTPFSSKHYRGGGKVKKFSQMCTNQSKKKEETIQDGESRSKFTLQLVMGGGGWEIFLIENKGRELGRKKEKYSWINAFGKNLSCSYFVGVQQKLRGGGLRGGCSNFGCLALVTIVRFFSLYAVQTENSVPLCSFFPPSLQPPPTLCANTQFAFEKCAEGEAVNYKILLFHATLDRICSTIWKRT